MEYPEGIEGTGHRKTRARAAITYVFRSLSPRRHKVARPFRPIGVFSLSVFIKNRRKPTTARRCWKSAPGATARGSGRAGGRAGGRAEKEMNGMNGRVGERVEWVDVDGTRRGRECTSDFGGRMRRAPSSPVCFHRNPRKRTAATRAREPASGRSAASDSNGERIRSTDSRRR